MLASFRKIFVVLTAIAGLALALKFLFSLNMSITPKKTQTLTPKQKEMSETLNNMLAKEQLALATISEAFDQFRKDKNTDSFIKKRGNQFAIIDSCHKLIEDMGTNADAPINVLKVVSALKLRKLVLERSHEVVIQYLTGSDKKDTDKLKSGIDDTEKEMESINDQISELLYN